MRPLPLPLLVGSVVVVVGVAIRRVEARVEVDFAAPRGETVDVGSHRKGGRGGSGGGME
jgi:hypothetical protein